MKRRLRTILAAAVASGLVSCAPSKVYLSRDYISARQVALLPAANDTNDLDGPVYVRQLLFEELGARGFHLVPMTDIDARLKEQGFTDGGQLSAATPQQLGQWIGADTLLYPILEEFNYVNVGYYWQRKVKISARLVDARSGAKLWEAERDFSTRGLATDKKMAEREFAVQLAAKALEKATHKPLARESQITVRELVATLPYR